VEAHTEEERARSVNLDGGRMGGMDLDGGGGWRGTDVEAVVAASRQTRRRSDRRGTGVKAVGAVSRRTRRRSGRRGGSQRGIKADAEEEWAPMSVWRGNDCSQG
jgi:hypothetical protein